MHIIDHIFILLIFIVLPIFSAYDARLYIARAKQTAGLGSLIYFLPHSRRELRYFYAVSITAGVVEEIVYRGFLIWYFGMFMPLWLAVLVSSIGFGLAHSYQGLGGVLKVCVIGLIFAALYILTGSIIIPIIAHMIVDVLQGLAIIEVLGEQDATPAAV